MGNVNNDNLNYYSPSNYLQSDGQMMSDIDIAAPKDPVKPRTRRCEYIYLLVPGLFQKSPPLSN